MRPLLERNPSTTTASIKAIAASRRKLEIRKSRELPVNSKQAQIAGIFVSRG